MTDTFAETPFPLYQRFRIEWTISNFSKELLRDNLRFYNKLIDSPEFIVSVNPMCSRKFRLRLEKVQSMLSVYLVESCPNNLGNSSAAKAKICFYYKIGLADCFNYKDEASWKGEGKVLFKHSWDHVRLSKLFNFKELSTGYREARYIRANKLKIIVRFDAIQLVNIPTVPKTMSEQFEKLFNNEKFSDFTLVAADDKEIPVHKSVLSVRSAVFETMMETEMKENSEKRAKIDDITPEALNEFLRFIYCGKVEGIEEHAAELLYAATKYDIQDLKPFCVVTLAENLSYSNALDTLMLADLHDEEELKRFCIDFIFWNYSEIKELKGWEHIPQSLYKEILDKVTESEHKTLTLESKIVLTTATQTPGLVPVLVPAARPAAVPAARPAQ